MIINKIKKTSHPPLPFCTPKFILLIVVTLQWRFAKAAVVYRNPRCYSLICNACKTAFVDFKKTSINKVKTSLVSKDQVQETVVDED